MRIKRILRSRLPDRFAGKLPPILVEIAVGIAVPLLIFAVRILLFPVLGETAPLAPIFVGIAAAAVLAGWRAGLLTLILGQALVWIFIMAPRGSLGPKEAVATSVFFTATACELAILVIIGLYQREIEDAWSKRETQLGLLQKALNEIDHRTSNNYQTVIALILAQAKSADAPVKEALTQVADRIRAIADASKKLAFASESLEKVRIADHLDELCRQIERGLSRPGVQLTCAFDDLVLDADHTVCISILVNELVTNALKHAFPDGGKGNIGVSVRRAGKDIELVVADSGVGMSGSGKSRGTGLGSKLIQTFVKQLKAKHEVTSDDSGTRHRIRFAA
jgi:two-component sensor histidine kinase